jgi:dimethylglycine dehydrogenase
MAEAGVDDGAIHLRVCGNELTGLSIAGPSARAVLDELTDIDVSNEAFPFLDIRETWIGSVPAVVGRISFTGDLGYEIWCAASYQQQLFDTLIDVGERHGLRLFGLRALDSMRLEKGWGGWATEYRPIYDPYEANMGWMVRLGKDFVGRDAAAAVKGAGPARKLVTFSMQAGTGDDAADCFGDEPIWLGDEVVGWVTSGGYAHHSGLSVALGYVPIEHADSAGPWELEVVGVRRPAELLAVAPFDPSGSRMRG